MGLSRAIIAGTVLGGAAATGIYVAVAAPAPAPPKPAAHSAAESAERASALRARPVPTFTKVVAAPCAAPSVLVHGVCVTHVAGRPTYLPAPAVAPAAPDTSLSDSSDAPAAPAAASPSAGPTGTPSAVTTPPAEEDEPEDATQGHDDEGHEDGDRAHHDEDDNVPGG